MLWLTENRTAGQAHVAMLTAWLLKGQEGWTGCATEWASEMEQEKKLGEK